MLFSLISHLCLNRAVVDTRNQKRNTTHITLDHLVFCQIGV